MGRLLPLLLLLGCKGSSLPATDGGGAPGECPSWDSSERCEQQQERQICSRAGVNGPERCKCDGYSWRCVDARCPLGEYPTGVCAEVGLRCNYGFEHSCECTPNGWICCGGVPDRCPFALPVEGSVCGCGVEFTPPALMGVCPPFGRCPDGVSCKCVDSAWRCEPLACVDASASDL